MNNPNDPAYPLYIPADRECPPEIDHGMTIRQRFVLAAIGSAVLREILDDGQTMQAAADELGIPISEYQWRRDYPRIIAKRVCTLADAALAEEARTRAKA